MARAIAILATGFIAAVVVAWLCAGLGTWPSSGSGTMFRQTPMGASDVPASLLSVPRESATVEYEPTYLVGGTLGLRRSAYTPSSSMFSSVDVYAAGWPMRALEWTWMWYPPVRADTRLARLAARWDFGIDYRGRGYVSPVNEWRRLPVRPTNYGAGMAVNTLVWSVLCWPLWLVGGGVVRRRRRRRGLCGGCGYPVRQADGRVLERCPECGRRSGGGWG